MNLQIRGAEPFTDRRCSRIGSPDGADVETSISTWEAQLPVGRLGIREEFAARAAVLCSSHAAYATSTSISVGINWNKSPFE